jgi:hypothetical protein
MAEWNSAEAEIMTVISEVIYLFIQNNATSGILVFSD